MSLTAAALYALVGVQGAGQSVRDLQSVSNQVDKTQGRFKGLGAALHREKTGFVQVGQGLLRVGETLAVAGVAAVAGSAKIGASFQSMTELIHTQAGATQDEVEKMRTGIMAMVHDVGTTPQELAKGIYHIESVGLRGADALDVLRASALGAKVGLADMESVTNALTAVQYSGITGTKSMTAAMGVLDGIVGVGNMHLQDLTDSFKSGILGTSKAFGVSLQSVGAAMATLTDAGVPANIAATRLNMTISHMGAPVPGAIKVLKELGISQFQLAKDMHGPDGINTALQDIGKHLQAVGEMSASGVLTPQGTAHLTKIFGGSRFGATALQLVQSAMAPTESGLGRIADKYKLIDERSKTFNANVEATKQTAGYVWGLLVADIQNAGLAFSQGFLPALARAGSKLDEFVFGHLGDIKTLGVELGNWIDKIDWNQVKTGANTFLSLMKSVLDVIGKIPPQVDAVVIGFLGLNKVSGGLLGKGVGNIVGGLTGILGALGKGVLRGALSKVPVVGGALSALTATPVFVTNWPGGLGGLGLAGAGEAAAGIGLGAVATAAAVGVVFVGGTLLWANSMLSEMGKNNVLGAKGLSANEIEAHKYYTGTAAFQQDFYKHMGHIPTIEDFNSGTVKLTGGAQNITPGGFDSRLGSGGVTAGGFTAAFRESNITMGGFDKRVRMSSKALEDMAAAARKAAHYDGSKALQHTLSGIEKRSMEKYHWKSGKPPKDWVMGTFGRDMIRYEQRILHSHQTAAQKLTGLQHLEAQAVAAKDWGVAHKLKTEINRVQNQIKHQKLHVNVAGTTVITNVRLGVGETIKTQTTYKKLGGTVVS